MQAFISRYGKVLLWITIFSIAMGFLETAVVIYLRELMYPEGFKFPLAPINPNIALTEVLREAATVIMLLGIAILSGKTKAERFAWFLYSFAIWDIFFYIFLKVLINWPESLLTWDILFLIPVTWVGPVISPVIVAFTMIAFALLINYLHTKTDRLKIRLFHWTFLITGSLVLILAWTWDYSKYILHYYSFKEIWTMPSKEPLYELAMQYIPQSFNWFLFLLGEFIIITGIFIFYRQNLNRTKK
ncbi:MAG: hypothetical protein JXB49_00810 [Bacteroidales bacterium]|nr:hypothetical protein [Bacteroidales bacterium]